MCKKKIVIGLGVTLLVLSVVVAILSIPSSATAQGLVEYGLCGEDTGTQVDPEYREGLEELFGLEEWQDDWGVVYLCNVKFDKKTKIFNKLTLCLTAYEDIGPEPMGYFSFGDIKLADVCENFKE